MPGTHLYAVNALLELPAYGRYAAGGRASLNGEIATDRPATEHGLREAIVQDVAASRGCDPAGITFVEFAYTDLSD